MLMYKILQFKSPQQKTLKTLRHTGEYAKQVELYKNRQRIPYLLVDADIFLLVALYFSTNLSVGRLLCFDSGTKNDVTGQKKQYRSNNINIYHISFSVPYHGMLQCHPMPCRSMPRHTMSCHIMLCHTIAYRIIPYFIPHYHIITNRITSQHTTQQISRYKLCCHIS